MELGSNSTSELDGESTVTASSAGPSPAPGELVPGAGELMPGAEELMPGTGELMPAPGELMPADADSTPSTADDLSQNPHMDVFPLSCSCVLR